MVRAVVLIAAVVAIAAGLGCNDSTSLVNPTSVRSTTAEGPRSLSGQVFELIPGSRVPAANIPVLAVVLTTAGCAAPCTSTTRATYVDTATGPDGRYSFAQLPAGSAVVLAGSPTYQQVCGAGAELSAATQLDVEITSRSNPQPSPTMPPLRVTGQVYEMTPAGRVGVSGASIGMDHHLPDAPFLTVFTDADGRYRACGIPANWPIGFDVGKSMYEVADRTYWRHFNADTTLDIEVRRMP
jgi:hypothetical protein